MTQTFHVVRVRVDVHADGLVEFDYAGIDRIDGAFASQVIALTAAEFKARGVAFPAPTLVRMGEVTHLTRDAREVYAGPDNARLCSRVALIALNPISRVIGSFFLGLNRPPQPTRLFGDVPTALAWLRNT